VSGGSSFAYRAARRNGTVEAGEVVATSSEEARTVLAARGLFPLELRALASTRAAHRPLPPEDVAVGLRVLATLLESGLPLARVLSALEELAPRSWARVLPGLRAAVREGRTVARAMSEASGAFPPLVVSLIAAGEAGSGLAPAVVRAAELAERSVETRRAVQGALAYPILLAGAGSASVALLVLFVLPRFAAILNDLGQRLPATARLLLAARDGASAGWLPLVALALLVAAGWKAWVATPRGEAQWHAALLEIPLAGRIRRAQASGRFASALGALLESGIPLPHALVHAARAAGDAAVAARVLAARELVIRGQRLASALQETDALTPAAFRLIRAGEESGQLVTMLGQAGRLESARGEQLVRGAVRVLEPSLIILFGGVVALVAASLLQAVYSVRPGR
jgi:general secretion pathway protein F